MRGRRKPPKAPAPHPFGTKRVRFGKSVGLPLSNAHASGLFSGPTRSPGRLTDAFRRLGLPFVPSAANFVLVEVGAGIRVYEALLRRGVIVRPMGGYGFPAHVRVTVGLPAENARCVEALAEVLGR